MDPTAPAVVVVTTLLEDRLLSVVGDPDPEPRPEATADEQRIEEALSMARTFLGLGDGATREEIQTEFKQPGGFQDFWEFFFRGYRADPETGVETPGPRFQKKLIARIDELVRSRRPRDEHAEADPREHGKSVVGSLAAPLYAVATELRHFPVVFSDTDPQALQRLDDIERELEDNELLQAVYPELCDFKRAGDEIELGNGTYIVAAGAGKSIRGLRRGRWRPDFLILDDVDRDAVAKNPERMKALVSWFRRVVRKLGRACGILVLGTVLHAACLLAQRIGYATQADGTRVLNPARVNKAIVAYPAELDGLWVEWQKVLVDWSIPGGEDERKAAARAFYDAHREEMERGAVLQWPEVFTLYELMLERAEDEASFLSEYQNDPFDPAGCYFPEDHLEFVDPENMPAAGDVVLSLFGWDPSLGKKKSDSSPWVRMDCLRDGSRLISEAICGQIPPEEVMAGGIAMHKMRAAQAVIVERIALSTFDEQLRQAALAEGIALPVEAFPAPGQPALNKELKIRAQRPLVMSKTLRFAASLPRPFTDQIRQWPQHRFDDAWDIVAELNRAADRLLQDVPPAYGGRDPEPERIAVPSIYPGVKRPEFGSAGSRLAERLGAMLRGLA